MERKERRKEKQGKSYDKRKKKGEEKTGIEGTH